MSKILLALTVAYLLFFFFGLPELSSCELAGGDCSKRLDRKDALIMAVISLLYAAIAFYNLGSTVNPQTFVSFSEGKAEVIELSEETDITGFMLYSGLNVGNYSLEVSNDGQYYTRVAEYEQNYVSIFKWDEVKLTLPAERVRFVRVYCLNGSPELGELGIRTVKPVTLSVSSLTDEQDYIPVKQNFINSSYFDEIYHARTAVEHLRGMRPYEITHPPLGKLIIAIGVALFGLTPLGWRFSGTFLGVLMLPIMYVFAKKLYGGRSVPTVCTAIFALDFMHFVQTRIATIDTYAVFFILLMYLFMYLYVSGESEHPTLMLFLSGLFFGFGAASKWTCLYAGAGLALIWAAYWFNNAKRLGFAAFLKNCLQCTVFFVLVPLTIYYVSYYPYGIANGLSGLGMFFDRHYLRIVLNNQNYMFSYHSGVDATHPYSSRWYQWVFNIRPILYYLEYDGVRQSSFGAWVNPVLCWGGLFSLFVLIYTAIFRRDKKAAFVLTGYLAQLVPWIPVSRITFEYHYFPCTVFLILSLGYTLKLIRVGDNHWKMRFSSLVVVSLAVFILFYPTLSGAWVDEGFSMRMYDWLETWPF